MKITPEIIAAVENMIKRERENLTHEDGEVNYAALAGMFEGLFRSMKFFDNAEEWFKLAIK